MNLRKGGRRLVVVVVVVSNGDRVRGITGTIPFYKFIFPRTRAKYTTGKAVKSGTLCMLAQLPKFQQYLHARRGEGERTDAE